MRPGRLVAVRRRPRHDALIGVGGIGAGTFFALSGNHTLGREESRGGRFLDRRDYCKLHIVAHYVRVLLGPAFTVVPVGRIGDDAAGRRLEAEMAAVGLDLRHLERAPGESTLFSFCLVYPDGGGGNLTTDNSACGGVSAAFVQRAHAEFDRYGSRAIALAMPEVPLDARAALLELATGHGSLRVASFTTGEVPKALAGGLLDRVDLLALNLDEAAAIAALPARVADAEEVVAAALRRLRSGAPGPRLSVTAGPAGSWCWDGSALAHLPALTVPVASTAGAGDAFLAGLLVGMESGLEMPQMQQLGTLVAGLAVTSPHTIHPELDLASLRALAGSVAPRTGWDPLVLALLDEAAALPDQDKTAAPAGR